VAHAVSHIAVALTEERVDGGEHMGVDISPRHPTQGFPKKHSQLVVNIAANLLSFGISIVVGFLFTPYLIRNLGIEAYGLIPLATTAISYFGLATIAVNGAVGRFLTIAIERQDSKEANRIFNTALMGNAIVVSLLLGPALLVCARANTLFSVPSGYDRSFTWLLYCIVCSFCVAALGSSFSLASYCRNRFDLSNSVDIAGNVLRIGTIIVLFRCFTPQVWHVGLAGVLAILFGSAASFVIWRRLMPAKAPCRRRVSF
jgi:membrane protein EpsK